jgi:dGTPase
MEAAQISRGIVLTLRNRYGSVAPALVKLLPSFELIETICFAHDLGHPPFGHAGERALNYCMRANGGFEGNGQTLRILSFLDKHTEGYGMNLTRRAMLGVIKYPTPYSEAARWSPSTLADQRLLGVHNSKPPKCYLDTEEHVVKWILSPFSPDDIERFRAKTEFYNERESTQEHAKTTFKSLDTSIMETADDIAYGIHDLEDMISLRLVSKDRFLQTIKYSSTPFLTDPPERLADALFGERTSDRKNAIGGLVNRLINHLEIVDRAEFSSGLLRYNVRFNDVADAFLKSLKALVYKTVVSSAEVQTVEYRGQQLILDLFAAFSSAPKHMLPRDYSRSIEAGVDEARVICDFVAGMTDAYATRLYERMFVPGQRSVFEKL